MTASGRTGTLDLSPNAVTVLERRYLVKDDQGKPAERPEDLFWRVARTIAEPDRRYGASDKAVEGLAETFFELMATRIWMPNSPTLKNARRNQHQNQRGQQIEEQHKKNTQRNDKHHTS